jgi:hypothetical protein
VTSVPPSLAEAWQAPSPATPVPVAVGPNVVTGGNGHVIGRDPLTGKQRWSYARNLSLCEVTQSWSKVLAVYRKGDYCSEITSLDATSGNRGAQRNGDAAPNTNLVSDGVYETSTGPTLLTTFRSDLVQTMAYGAAPDANNAGRQPRVGCTYRSVAANNSRIGVVEHCGPGSNSQDNGNDRFTEYEATNKDADRPSVDFSVPLPGNGARVVAMNAEYAAIALPNPSRLLVLSAEDGSVAKTYPLSIPSGDITPPPAGGAVQVTTGDSATYWDTGSSMIALDEADFHPRWTAQGALGPGTLFAGRELVPVPGGLDVLDAVSGKKLANYPVDRHGYQGRVGLSSLGPVVFEQRGNTLVALR